MSSDIYKREVANAALCYLTDIDIIGIGTGSTVNCLIDALADIRHRITVVSSSQQTTARLQERQIQIAPLNSIVDLGIYIDGADEASRHRQLIKGGGGALTREKIIAAASRRFICLIDESKLVDRLGHFPLPVEVIPMAQSYVARQIAALGARPILRQGVHTDNGNIILDVHDLDIMHPTELESNLNQIAGVVCHGLFAKRPADLLLVGGADGICKFGA